MPSGTYPERISEFKKWANSKVSKGSITNRATAKRKTRRKRWRSTTGRKEKAHG